MNKSIEKRLAELDWEAIYESLWSYGYALTAPLLTAEECGELIERRFTLGVIFHDAK